jgi:hypothetical protein
MNQDDQEKKQIKEYEKNPMSNLSDSVNRSMIGDLRALTKGGCLTKMITLIIIIVGGLLILSRCSH